ncbi:hypothetical protein BGZ70_008714 [Mortierella alpina]|uniref:Invertebrate defensins family profile domain-containing protein n=1 Tax=Mortierella alpina TaxID=64518 RepID=A0A9P6JDX8_MORAP|nr:hypothetical protein BGZ70_008714 [Mortierella alpina]
MSSATAPAKSNNKGMIKMAKLAMVALVVTVLLVKPAEAGFGCPGDERACNDHCKSINRNGGYCGGFLYHTCKCNQS